jgi:DNA-binding FrmR family transcriptional regulator
LWQEEADMPFQFSKAAIIEKNNAAIAAAQAVINRLDEIGGLPTGLEKKRLAQRTRARNLITQLRTVNANLRAAGTVVKPLSDAVAEELNELGNVLDQQIASDAILNATLDFVTSVLNDVGRLQAIVRSAQA